MWGVFRSAPAPETGAAAAANQPADPKTDFVLVDPIADSSSPLDVAPPSAAPPPEGSSNAPAAPPVLGACCQWHVAALNERCEAYQHESAAQGAALEAQRAELQEARKREVASAAAADTAAARLAAVEKARVEAEAAVVAQAQELDALRAAAAAHAQELEDLRQMAGELAAGQQISRAVAAAMEQELTDLRQKSGDSAAAQAALDASRAAAVAAQVQALEQELVDLRQTARDLAAAQEATGVTAHELERELETSHATAAAKAQELAALEQSVDSLSDANSALQGKLLELRTDRDALRAQQAGLQHARTEAEREIGTLKGELLSLRLQAGARNDAGRQLGALQGELEKLLSRQVEQQHAVTQAEREVETLRAEVVTLRVRAGARGEAEREMEALRGELEALRRELAAAERRAAETKDIIRALGNQAPIPAPTPAPAPASEFWSCPTCTLHNPSTALQCGVCERPKPNDA